MGCLFMLSDYIIYGGYRLLLDNDIIKVVWLDKNNLVSSPKLYANNYAIFISIYFIYQYLVLY